MMNYHQHYQTELTNVMLIENIIVCLDSLLRPQDTSTETLAQRYVKAKISIKLLNSQCSEKLHTDIGRKSAQLIEYVDRNLTMSPSRLADEDVHKQIEILQNLKSLVKKL
jgi:hypothetical protein